MVAHSSIRNFSVVRLFWFQESHDFRTDKLGETALSAENSIFMMHMT